MAHPLSRSGAEWFTHQNGDVFKFVHKDVEMTLPRPNLQGSHQIANAGAAIAALEIIKDQFPVSPDALKAALQKNPLARPACKTSQKNLN
jgi:dihydrofolate synthase/folylpolyglutamate synthase